MPWQLVIPLKKECAMAANSVPGRRSRRRNSRETHVSVRSINLIRLLGETSRLRRLKFSAERERGRDEATCESNAKGNKGARE